MTHNGLSTDFEKGGWNEGQARALCDVLREIIRGVAMSSELERVESSLRSEIKSVESSLLGKIESVESSLQAEIKSVESSLRSEIKSVESSLEGRMVALKGQMVSLRLIMLAGFGFLGVLIALENFL